MRGLTVCQYFNLRLSLGGLGEGIPPPPGGGEGVAAFRVVICSTWALFGRCLFESIVGFVRCKRWRTRGVAKFDSQSATIQRFRPLRKLPLSTLQPAAQPLQPATLQPAACSATVTAFSPAACSLATLQPCSQQLCSLHPSLQMRKGSALAEGLQI